ncbi:alpha/beta fold hydrolase [Euzebya sp.]|uniref:alpha/beta fold hydrolase n=1 Tax=Euzebya sp. TaxID=1971409 RepID=UPI0035139D50
MELSSRGVDLHVTDQGSGRPLVMISGWTFGASVFDRNVERLAAGHRVVTVDLRGHGGSAGVGHGWDIPTAAADVAALLSELDLDGAVLVGWSMGAQVAVHTALSHPGLSHPGALAGLVLIDMTPRVLAEDGWPHAAFGGLTAEAAFGIADGFQRDREATGGELLPSFFASPPDEETAGHFGTDHGRCPTEAVVSYLASMGAQDLRGRATEIAVPTLVLTGAESAVYPSNPGSWWAEELPDATSQVIPDAGHALFWEQPDAFADAVEGFTARLG